MAFGIFSGGLIMKKFRIDVLGAAKLSLGSSFFGYLLLLSLFAMGCENSDVAGLTVSYHGYAGKGMLQPKVPLKLNFFLILFHEVHIAEKRKIDLNMLPRNLIQSGGNHSIYSSGHCVRTLS